MLELFMIKYVFYIVFPTRLSPYTLQEILFCPQKSINKHVQSLILFLFKWSASDLIIDKTLIILRVKFPDILNLKFGFKTIFFFEKNFVYYSLNWGSVIWAVQYSDYVSQCLCFGIYQILKILLFEPVNNTKLNIKVYDFQE